jgi:predicted transcriptional regulator
VQFLVRLSPGERKQLHRIALETDTTAQALVEDAIRDIIARNPL